ncbi:MAG TPA: serine/threonine-protein kinase [Vicinamibacteria bacterium]|nr:serine/threonine-protein kinase [Vicinamibacteria bacterium]
MADDVIGPGARIDDYEILDRLGAGGMGEVYRARDTRLGRTVALKVLRAGADPDLLRRLDREARAASALNHPHIVHIYDVGEAPGAAGAHFIVMELVEGETLRRHLANGPLPMAELLELGAQLADGLARAHRAGIVHRDLKPENVMVTPEGRAKILDFGLAKVTAPLADSEGETVSRYGTRAGTLLGTLEYMSPEQATGRPVDHRTDQFALGLILHEMATGRPSFRRDTPAQVLAAVIERDPEPLGRLRPDAPPELEALVARCVQKDPEKRFAKTDDIAVELAGLAGRSRSRSMTDARAISVEVLPARERRPRPTVYHLQEGDKVRTYEEEDLAEKIRKQKLSGMELVRREDDERWLPLFETRVYRLEVPNAGDPQSVARSRALRALFGHFSGFFITGVVMYSTQGHLPFWMAIWGAVLAMQVLGSGPALWSLWKRHRVASSPVPELPPLAAAAPLPAPAPTPPTTVVAQEAARVRALIQQHGGKEAARLIDEVDKILRLTGALADREADLQEQTSEQERASLTSAIAEARGRLERAELAPDRRLFERQLEVLQGREEAIAKAVRVLERLRVRRDLAEHQLKQLRLDLSRGAASGLDVPELSSRLQFIRYEVDAREEVEQIAAERK